MRLPEIFYEHIPQLTVSPVAMCDAQTIVLGLRVDSLDHDPEKSLCFACNRNCFYYGKPEPSSKYRRSLDWRWLLTAKLGQDLVM